MITKDKKMAMKKKYYDAENYTKKLWKTTKDNLGWTRNLSPNTLSFNGKTIHKPIEIANTINLAHISRNLKLHREIPKNNIDPIKNFQKLTTGENLIFNLKTLTMNELRKMVREMKSSPSAGIDCISMKTLKQIFPAVEAGVLNLINTCFTTGVYPRDLKSAKIIPLLKNGKPPTNPLSYRGVNILSSMAKIIDKAANMQITKHLVTNDLLLHEHNGGIKGRGTITAVNEMLDEWAYALEEGKNTAILALDLSATFDVVFHPILLKKLENLGFQQTTMQFFTLYLKDRKQRVSVDSFLSDELHIGPLSVCQGSTLSGLLYLIYTLDYPLIFQERILPISQQIMDDKPTIKTFVDDSINRIKITR